MAKANHRSIFKYSDEFKATAVALSHLRDVAVLVRLEGLLQGKT